MRSPSESYVVSNTYAAQPGSVLNLYVNGGNTVGGKYNSTPSILAANTNSIILNGYYYNVANSGYATNKTSYASLPIQIWEDTNPSTRRSWIYMNGPYSNNFSLSIETTAKFLYSTNITYDSDPETIGYYSYNTQYSGSKISSTYDIISPVISIHNYSPSQELFFTVINGTDSPIDVRAPVSYYGVISSNNIPDTTITGSLEFNIINSTVMFGNALESFTPSPNNYTRQVDFVNGSTIYDATVIPRKQQTWIIG